MFFKGWFIEGKPTRLYSHSPQIENDVDNHEATYFIINKLYEYEKKPSKRWNILAPMFVI